MSGELVGQALLEITDLVERIQAYKLSSSPVGHVRAKAWIQVQHSICHQIVPWPKSTWTQAQVLEREGFYTKSTEDKNALFDWNPCGILSAPWPWWGGQFWHLELWFLYKRTLLGRDSFRKVSSRHLGAITDYCHHQWFWREWYPSGFHL